MEPVVTLGPQLTSNKPNNEIFWKSFFKDLTFHSVVKLIFSLLRLVYRLYEVFSRSGNTFKQKKDKDKTLKC